MAAQDLSVDIQQQVAMAVRANQTLRIVGSDSKAFYGPRVIAQQRLELGSHRGIINYEPSELVITARAGTRLTEIQTVLATHQQMLAFEPPAFGTDATLGGTIACGFSGPRRPFAGSARDFMLGCKLLNGRAEILNFGGQVMKNVAGFDVSRLMVGARGSLGVLLDISLRVLPMPEVELSWAYPLTLEKAIEKMATLAGQPWPISGLAYDGEQIHIRLAGAESAVSAAARQIGGEMMAETDTFWQDLREQKLAFFQQSVDLWRFSIAPATPPLAIAGDTLLDWGGALRWMKTSASVNDIHLCASLAGGYASCFKGQQLMDWQRLAPELLALQQRIKQAFDPLQLFNPVNPSY